MANALTSIRILCGLMILVFPAFSKWYYVLYLIGGFTDAVDGTIARKLGTATPFGAKYDTVADCIFTLAVVVKIVSTVSFPIWLLLWIFIIITIKIANLVIGLIRYKRLVTVHSPINKVCGIVVFILPFFIGGEYVWQAKEVGMILVCLLASVASVDESIKVWNGKAAE